ncbi:MAG: hypothetical protein JO337_10140 [Acidimicrobiales bacterium]|nr:hypothetical protein [Acidimicrobiales bacterium]
MHVRITTATGVTNLDAGVAVIRDEILPGLRQQNGFRGLAVSGDRASGMAMVLSQWDSAADLDASESVAEKARNDAMKAMGGEMTVARFEQVLWEVVTQPSAGSKLQVRDIKMDPARIDENLAFFEEAVVPEMKKAKGFLAVRNMINRDTGGGRVGTLWADDESVQAWMARTEERRAIAREHGVEFGQDRLLEVLLAAME